MRIFFISPAWIISQNNVNQASFDWEKSQVMRQNKPQHPRQWLVHFQRARSGLFYIFFSQ